MTHLCNAHMYYLLYKDINSNVKFKLVAVPFLNSISDRFGEEHRFFFMRKKLIV